MTVQELIERLQKIEDKEMKVKIPNPSFCFSKCDYCDSSCNNYKSAYFFIDIEEIRKGSELWANNLIIE